MSEFQYTALDADGRNRRGVIEGDSPEQARRRLRERSLTPLTLHEIQAHKKGRGGFRGVKNAELALATRQLAILASSGQPVADCLETASRQTDNQRLRAVLLAVRGRVQEGRSFADGLGAFPYLFSDLYRETVAAGERSGRLDQVLERLADHLENSHKLRQAIVLAMVYPVIVLVFALLISVGLLTFVVPQVVQVFSDFDHELPLLTQGLIAVSDFLNAHGLVLAAGVVLAVLGLRALFAREGPKRAWHRVLLSLPLTARLTRGVNTARFARTFGILTQSGVPVLEGLRISGRVVHNRLVREAVAQAAVRVREGGSLWQALSDGRVFSPLVVNLIASGESSGNLAQMLERAADAQEREVETSMRLLAGLVEPFLILFMGGLVLTIVMAILMPIFDLNRLIS